jgi:hypothetical protein
MTRANVEKFIQLHKENTGEELSYGEALENLIKTVEIVREIYKPIKKDDYEKFINNNEN